jgi:hypothetical protein
MYAKVWPVFLRPRIKQSWNHEQLVSTRFAYRFSPLPEKEHALSSSAPSSGTTNYRAGIGLKRTTPPHIHQSIPSLSALPSS